MLFGTLVFVVLVSIAVGLDLGANFIQKLGISEFTHKAVEHAAYGMLLLDLVLFAVYLLRSSINSAKETFR